jgi:hypothetical protein
VAGDFDIDRDPLEWAERSSLSKIAISIDRPNDSLDEAYWVMQVASSHDETEFVQLII